MSKAEVIEPKKETTAPLVGVGSKGELAFSNHVELRDAASLAIKLPFTPQHLREQGLEAVAAALLFLKQRGLPQSAMNQCAYIKGKLTQYGSLVTALAEMHPEYGERRDFFIDEKGEEICSKNKNLKSATPWAAVVQIKKKGSDTWNEYSFSEDDAIKAGLLTSETKKDSGWKKYFKDMIFHKANARALKANYASALEGINYHEDLVEKFLVSTERNVTNSIDKAASLNKKFIRQDSKPVTPEAEKVAL